MDFALTPELIDLRDRTRRFVVDHVLPFEGDPRESAHGPSEDLRPSSRPRRAPRDC
jgi:acyl-CoA dehydrogenase